MRPVRGLGRLGKGRQHPAGGQPARPSARADEAVRRSDADERRHHFLQRFAAAMPGWGGMAVLDRSWYGRVLVERVEGFATEPEWRRAYPEIVKWEQGHAAEGMVLVKFWLHISEDEQLRRFRRPRAGSAQALEAHRRGLAQPLAPGGLRAGGRGHARRDRHEAAPWHVVAAESKHYARVTVLEIVIATIEDALRKAGQDPVDVEAAL